LAKFGHVVFEISDRAHRHIQGGPKKVACFADIDVSQGSVATYARCGGIFNIHLTTNLPRNVSVKNFLTGQDLTELWS